MTNSHQYRNLCNLIILLLFLFRLMRALADHTRMNPDRRIERLQIFNKRLRTNADSEKILQEWNMKLDDRLVEVEGRILDQQKIVFREHRK